MKPTTSMFLSGFFLGIAIGIAIGIFCMSMVYKFSNNLKQECVPSIEKPVKENILNAPIDHVA